MTADRWQRVERIYHEAALQTPPERQIFLDRACAGDQDLRGEVERMLSGEAAAGSSCKCPRPK